MYEDEPQDKVHDVLAGAVFGDHPLGRPVIGAAEVIALDPGARHRRLPRRPLHWRQRSSWRRRATSSTSAIVELAERLRLAATADRRRRERAPPDADEPRGCASTRRRPSSTTSASAAPGSPATTSAASRSPSSTRSSAARPRRACSRRCARSAASPTRSAPTRASTRTPARSRMYVGTREDNVAEALRRDRPRARARCATSGSRDEELARAKEHVKGRLVLSMESTARAHEPPRPLDPVRRAAADARRDARARRGGHARGRRPSSPRELYAAERLSAAAIGRERGPASASALAPGRAPSSGARRDPRRRLRAPRGAWGRPCARRSRAPTTWSSSAGPTRARGRRSTTCSATPTWWWTSPRRTRRSATRAPASRPACTRWSAPPASTSSSCDELRERRRRGANCFVAPELRDRRGADDAGRAADRAAHARVRDRRAPPRRQARRAVGHGEAHRRADRARPAATSTSRSTRCGCPASSPTRR